MAITMVVFTHESDPEEALATFHWTNASITVSSTNLRFGQSVSALVGFDLREGDRLPDSPGFFFMPSGGPGTPSLPWEVRQNKNRVTATCSNVFLSPGDMQVLVMISEETPENLTRRYTTALSWHNGAPRQSDLWRHISASIARMDSSAIGTSAGFLAEVSQKNESARLVDEFIYASLCDQSHGMQAFGANVLFRIAGDGKRYSTECKQLVRNVLKKKRGDEEELALLGISAQHLGRNEREKVTETLLEMASLAESQFHLYLIISAIQAMSEGSHNYQELGRQFGLTTHLMNNLEFIYGSQNRTHSTSNGHWIKLTAGLVICVAGLLVFLWIFSRKKT